jgi:hypothetical protein
MEGPVYMLLGLLEVVPWSEKGSKLAGLKTHVPINFPAQLQPRIYSFAPGLAKSFSNSSKKLVNQWVFQATKKVRSIFIKIFQ